jgi:hypothetical protein
LVKASSCFGHKENTYDQSINLLWSKHQVALVIKKMLMTKASSCFGQSLKTIKKAFFPMKT